MYEAGMGTVIPVAIGKITIKAVIRLEFFQFKPQYPPFEMISLCFAERQVQSARPPVECT